jgi:hypothetical protein
MHVPAEHTAPDPHCMPHAPQFAASLSVSVQTPAHACCPAGHVQAPPAQLRPPVHAVAQAPQWAPSVVRSTQLASHWVRPLAHVVPQAPSEHTVPAAQTLPHAPQF